MGENKKLAWAFAAIKKLGIVDKLEQEVIKEIAFSCGSALSFFQSIKILYSLENVHGKKDDLKDEKEKTELVIYENTTLSPISSSALRELDKDD